MKYEKKEGQKPNMNGSIKYFPGAQMFRERNARSYFLTLGGGVFFSSFISVTLFGSSPTNHTTENAAVQSNSINLATLPTPARICDATNKSSWVSVSSFAHLLLFYHREATDLPVYATGDMMIKALTDETTALNAFGSNPLLKTKNGVRYYLFDDPVFRSKAGEAHRDQCLATFADLDLPRETRITLKSGSYSIADLISESIASFSWVEREPAWTAIAYARYLPPQKDWINKFGQKFTFSQLVQHLFQVNLNAQSCAGTHVFEALIRIYKADRAHNILDPGTRSQLANHLSKTVQEVIQNQQLDGGWNRRWCEKINNDIGTMMPTEARLLATGHLLQMLNELPQDLQPSKDVYLRAAAWLTSALNSAETHYDASWLCPFTHGALSARTVLTRFASVQSDSKISLR